MSKIGTLRAFVNERLTVAVEEIFVEFERTITDYEDEVTRLKAENIQQQKTLDCLDTIFKTQRSLNRKGLYYTVLWLTLVCNHVCILYLLFV